MARPMRTPVQWDRGSVSVTPIKQPFKGILEEYGIPESAYSAEGGFGGSGLLDWEPAEFTSPDVVWGTQYVSTAPPPSHYRNGDDEDGKDDKKDGCDSGFHKVGGVCVKDTENPCIGVTCGSKEKCVNGACVPIGDDDPCVGVNCGPHANCVNGNCIPEEIIDPCIGVNCGPHADCVNGACVPIGGGGNGGDDDDGGYDVVGPGMEDYVVSTGPEPDYGNVFDDGGYVPPAPVIPDISGLLNDDPYVPNPYVDTFTTAFPTVYGTPYEDEITSPFYDPWAPEWSIFV